MELPYRLIRSDRKTVAIHIKDGEVTVRAPRRAKLADIERFLLEKRQWIEKAIAAQNAQPKLPALTEDEVRELAEMARVDIPQRAVRFAALLGVTYGRITIRNQRTKWGSCSSKGNLNFNCVLMLTPEWVRDYIVIHELCHLKHMDHSPAFWAEVTKLCPQWKAAKAWLKDNSAATIGRL